ncbi:MAG TPA: TauD/TfdA family dioxygenase [Pyrinomonadaceae bacterium]
MKPTEAQNSTGKSPKLFGRKKPVTISSEQLVRTSDLQPGQSLPLLIQPAVPDVDLPRWAQGNRDFIDAELYRHGGLLFRDFNVRDVSVFEQFVRDTSDEMLAYRERSSPRSQVSGNIYTSTDYPAGKRIFLHNENSYQHVFPLKLYFCCVVPPAQGGQTSIADCRRVLARISAETRARFESKGGWMLVRNFRDDLGLPWQTVFQTENKTEVEQYCAAAGIEWEWRGNLLRTRQVRPVVAKHVQTGEEVWFNHATFFHLSTLEPAVQQALADEYGEEDLPNQTYYADGSPIEPSVLDELRDAYRQETVIFDWQRGDILMLDNMLVAHGRETFTGARTIVVGMADPATRAGSAAIPAAEKSLP